MSVLEYLLKQIPKEEDKKRKEKKREREREKKNGQDLLAPALWYPCHRPRDRKSVV